MFLKQAPKMLLSLVCLHPTLLAMLSGSGYGSVVHLPAAPTRPPHQAQNLAIILDSFSLF